MKYHSETKEELIVPEWIKPNDPQNVDIISWNAANTIENSLKLVKRKNSVPTLTVWQFRQVNAINF